jgi:hypothetical protein
MMAFVSASLSFVTLHPIQRSMGVSRSESITVVRAGAANASFTPSNNPMYNTCVVVSRTDIVVLVVIGKAENESVVVMIHCSDASNSSVDVMAVR